MTSTHHLVNFQRCFSIDMPPPAFTRNATGRRRRHVVRRTKYLLRSKGLNARKQWQSHLYQQMRAAALIRFGQTLGWMSSCAVVYMINALNDVVDPNMLLSLLLGSSLLELYARHADMYTILDAILSDIPDNEDWTVHWGPPRHRRINDFETDDNARALTRFTKTQLYDILQLLALPHFVDVWCAFLVREYTIFIEKSFSFPVFAEAIANHVGRDVARLDATTRQPYIVRGLQFAPPEYFRIFGFVDASLRETCTPETGPDGDYEGAPRKEMSDAMQRAVYTGWKKQHGLKIQTVILPNGMSFVDGPYSMREYVNVLLLFVCLCL
jgi:hypothetical protein